MSGTKQVRDALPFTIQAYTFTGGELGLNAKRPCPGKSYIDTNEIIVRVYNATIAEEAGFCGEVIAIGDYVDTYSIGDYVFGGKQKPALQPYIVVKPEDLAVLPSKMSPAAAARLYAATPVYAALQNLEMGQRVAILGDMTGFAVQIAVQKKCIVTSSEPHDVGETAVIEEDNFLEYLSQQPDPFDVIVDATGDLDLYAYCEQFTTRAAEYISINPINTIQATKAQLLPAFLGGGTRKLTVSKLPVGQHKADLLNTLAKEVQEGRLRVLDQRVVSFEAVLQVYPAIREVTVVNVIKQSELTPEEPEEPAQPKNKGKAKAVAPSPKPKRSPTQKRRAPTQIAEQAASPNKNYSPRKPSRLQESILADQAGESSPEMRDAGFMGDEQHKSLHALQNGAGDDEIAQTDLIDHATPPRKTDRTGWPRQATLQDEYELSDLKHRQGTLLFDAGIEHQDLSTAELSLPDRSAEAIDYPVDEGDSEYEDIDDADDEEEEADTSTTFNKVQYAAQPTAQDDKAAALKEAEDKIAALQRQIEMLSRVEIPVKQQVTVRKLSKERRKSKESSHGRSSKEEERPHHGLLVDTEAAHVAAHSQVKTPSPTATKHKRKDSRHRSSSGEDTGHAANPDVLANESEDEEESSKLIN
ncbi:hypothetical protein BCR37DRAFT_391776 [Protomyces lactucae-debilis]|uniref:Enoyl reductase (ER) domain-containing protein n=1 Tax=Protomyces lactucae-debilis TaxID=2754530 RepID=A0A1Y2FM91_PROLT|nr:uncharacterized protein BCR37DRAFT_391776 [Protomyces lactucae-debilis]ORY85093.1 hypothetical protein BCR37DRAFT_391776 [Protomyces lactucae-debilis]